MTSGEKVWEGSAWKSRCEPTIRIHRVKEETLMREVITPHLCRKCWLSKEVNKGFFILGVQLPPKTWDEVPPWKECLEWLHTPCFWTLKLAIYFGSKMIQDFWNPVLAFNRGLSPKLSKILPCNCLAVRGILACRITHQTCATRLIGVPLEREGISGLKNLRERLQGRQQDSSQ